MVTGLLAGAARGNAIKAAVRAVLAPSRFVVVSLPKAALNALVAPALGVFGAGVVLGAGLGVLLAPTSGRELRAKFGAKVSGLMRRSDSGTKG